eukprot:CAMPEP_0170462332 /NCGR_PEP_ID=MMETSP0123-20130129/7878_1 /TAXON_ID=182087 /ORGANISM="Favella ehrenbergii, Strain Fehren 1" /LENGTH=114 /DNA_ID=CAMNT_0010727527 /DNA_START=33 /DNA_END=380 /DNA_ORIENTATION=-
MAQSAQAAAFRLKFHNEYESFKKNQDLKRQADRMRTRQLSKSSTRSNRSKRDPMQTQSNEDQQKIGVDCLNGDEEEWESANDSQLKTSTSRLSKTLALPKIDSGSRSFSTTKKR